MKRRLFCFIISILVLSLTMNIFVIAESEIAFDDFIIQADTHNEENICEFCDYDHSKTQRSYYNDDYNDDLVITRGEPHDCGGTLNRTFSYGPYGRTGSQRFCTHKPFGVDLEMMRYVKTTYKCTKCQSTYEVNVPEYTWECHGFY